MSRAKEVIRCEYDAKSGERHCEMVRMHPEGEQILASESYGVDGSCNVFGIRHTEAERGKLDELRRSVTPNLKAVCKRTNRELADY